VLFLDEPTTGLDPRARLQVWDIIRDLVSTGVTVLLTTQYLDEADQLAGEVVVIDHGRVIAAGTPDELKRQTGAQTLAVRPDLEADAEKVRAVVAELASKPEVASGLVTAQVTDPAVLAAVVRRLDDAGVRIAELTLRTSTLDEVFLSLTGHRAEPEGVTA
jgi:oleandomycin transport system ATP-binding protein